MGQKDGDRSSKLKAFFSLNHRKSKSRSRAGTPGTPSSTPSGSSTLPVPRPSVDAVLDIETQRSILWKEAYEGLRRENEPLVQGYEAVLQDETDIPSHIDGLPDQLTWVAKAQQRRVQNRQWQFQWFGHPQPVRDAIERILSITQKSSSLLSVGMNQAPPYVSIPWCAVAALIPLMMNEFKEHKGCIAGLERIAKLTFSYQMAEQTFLASDGTRDAYKKSVIDLYKKILEYQALAVRYFGRSTLQRLGVNIGAASTAWSDMPSLISSLDTDTRRSLQFLGQRTEIAKLADICQLLERQEKEINKLIQGIRARGDEIAQVTRWVSAVSAELDHHDIRQKLGEAHFSSGGWLLDHPLVQAWKGWVEADSRCLWLKGGVGSGKSSLVSILIEDLLRSPDGLVAFFYCSRKSDKNHENSTARNDYENALRSILAQAAVSEDGKTVHSGLVKRFDLDPRGLYTGLGLSADECVENLTSVFTQGQNQKFTIIIDALDECADHDSLLQALLGVFDSNSNVRLFLTSRFEVKVQDYFPQAACVEVGEQNTKDIQRFLEIEIPRRRSGSGISDLQVARLSSVIMQRAAGMFVWVKLQVNLFLAEIKSQRIRFEQDIEKRLVGLEKSKTVGEELLYGAYGEVYEIAIGKNEEYRRHVVVTALRWVLCAFRTLTLRELAFATAVREDGTFASGIQEGLVLDLCSNLLVEDTTGAVRLAHLSVRHFLEDRTPPDFIPEHSHLQAALTCLYFLKSPYYKEFGSGQTETLKPKNTDVILTRGFHTYVAQHWSRHCRVAKKEESLQALMNLSDSDTSVAHTSQGTISESLPETEHGYDETAVDSSKLFVSFLRHVNSSNPESSEGATDPFSVEQFIARGSDLGIKGDTGTTILHECIRLRLDALTQLLVDAGAPLDAPDPHDNTPLHFAAIHRGVRGAQLLLLAGANKHAKNFSGQTPLHVAVAFGSQDVAETLLSANARALEKDIHGDTPMHYAASMGNSMFVEHLLLLGYSPNGRNTRGESALSMAIRSGHVGVVKALLDRDAVITQDDLSEAKSSSDPRLAKLIAERKAKLLAPEASKTSTVEAYPFQVEFQDPDLRPCDYCDISSWIKGSGKGTTYRHHSSMYDLGTSAEGGCPLCRLFHDDLNAASARAGTIPVNPDAPLIVTVEPASAQGGQPDRKDKLIVLVGKTKRLTYELCLNRSNPTSDPIPVAVNWISGTTVDQRPMVETGVQTTDSWIKTCLSSHGNCWKDQGEDPILPKMVLDIGTDASALRLVRNDGTMRGRYAYVSARWIPGRSSTVATTISTLPQFLQKIDADSLSATFLDTINMLRQLGIPYLWVDSLCVVQDLHDRHQEWLEHVPNYIRNAFFVVVIASDDLDSGFHHPREPGLLKMKIVHDLVNVPDPKEAALESETGISKRSANQEVELYIRRPLETASEALGETVLTRVWMIQEVVLPHRMLIVGKEQLYWHCRTALLSEGSRLALQPFMTLSPRTETMDKKRSYFPWYILMNIYSRCGTTIPEDKVAALGGMAPYFNLDGRFVMGLWVDDFTHGILWYVEDVRHGHDHVDLDVAPSWSWLSLGKRQVRYNLLWGVRHDTIPPRHLFSVVDIQGQLPARYGGDPTRALELKPSIAYAEVAATVLGIRFPRDWKDYIFFLDKLEHEIEWRASTRDLIFLFVCTWKATPTKQLHGSFGLGLILEQVSHREPRKDCRVGHNGDWAGWCRERGFPEERANDVYTRVGLCLMPNWKEKVDGGTRRKVILV